MSPRAQMYRPRNPRTQPHGNLARLIELKIGEAGRILSEAKHVGGWSITYSATQGAFFATAYDARCDEIEYHRSPPCQDPAEAARIAASSLK